MSSILDAVSVDRSLRVRKGQFVDERVAKRRVVLHHTADGSPRASLAWWNQDPKRIATAYVIDRDGTKYEMFNPACWAWHTGTSTAVDRPAIGIELTNWGFLTKRGEKYFNWKGGEIPADDVVEAPWRGERYWHRYTEAQIDAVLALVPVLCDEFGIDRDVAPAIWDARHADYSRFQRFEGVISHAHIRADKTDLHPVFPWDRLTAVVENRIEAPPMPMPVRAPAIDIAPIEPRPHVDIPVQLPAIPDMVVLDDIEAEHISFNTTRNIDALAAALGRVQTGAGILGSTLSGVRISSDAGDDAVLSTRPGVRLNATETGLEDVTAAILSGQWATAVWRALRLALALR